MITPGFVQTMAVYGAEMNRRWYAAAARLTPEQRDRDEGAFFGSIQRTLSHVLWADRMWMSRLDGWERPPAASFGPVLFTGFEPLRAARAEADAGIEAWAARVGQDWLDGELVWFSGGLKRDARSPRALIVMHLFNHATHHRGQVHALLTRAGADPGVTDLPFMFPEAVPQP